MGRARADGGRIPLSFLTNAWRRRWGSLVLLALLVALTGGMAMAGVAGARRSASAPTRFEQVANGRDLFVSGADEDPGPLDAILDGPLVESHSDQVFVFAQPSFEEQLFTFAPTSDEGLDIERGVLLSGRRADPTNPDEIVVSEVLADRYDLQPGDVFDLVSISPEQVPAVIDGRALESADGPPLALHVAGVVRTSSDIAARPDDLATLTLSPAFVDRYRDEVGMGFVSHQVRLVDEPGALDRFTDEAAAAYPGEQLTFDLIQVEDAQSDSIGVATGALLTLGLLVALAGGLWIAAVTIRQQRLLNADAEVLRALGSTPRERAALLAGAVAPAVVVGALVAPAVAVAISPLFPVGLARRYDPDLGVHVDLPVVLLGVLVVAVLLGAVVIGSAWRIVSAARRSRSPRSRPPRLDRIAAALPPAPAMGTRFALFTPRTVAAPVRPAVAGACLAVIGLTAVAVVGASLDRVVATPPRWGTTWDVALTAVSGQPDVDPSPLLEDPAVAAAAFGHFDEQVTIDDVEAIAMVIEPVRGDIGVTVIEGRQPQAEDEVVVGRATLDRLGVPVGSTVEIGRGSVPPVPSRIVGVAVFPTVQFSAPLDDGAAFSLPGWLRLGLGDPTQPEGEGTTALLLRWAPGAEDPALLEPFVSGGLIVLAPIRPPEVNGLDDVKWFPTVAATCLVVLGAIATSQAIAVTTRRRRGEFGVLAVLGFTQGQRRTVVAVQATVIAIVALVIGIPLGIAAARFVWDAIAGSMGLATDIDVPITTLVIGGLATIVVLNLISAISARLAGRVGVADALRVE